MKPLSTRKIKDGFYDLPARSYDIGRRFPVEGLAVLIKPRLGYFV